jgi:hypothetical protein
VNGQDETKVASPVQQGPPSKEEDRDEVEVPASADESADVNAESAKGSQVSQAPIVLTEEL